MNAIMGRAPLVFTLALASRARLGRRTPAGLPATPHSGRIASVVPHDGALLVDTTRGPILLVVAWDAEIRGPRDLLKLADLRKGDVVEWTDEGGESIAMVDDLRVVRADAR